MERDLKLRARQVCVRCHQRKVRCDLQNQTGQKCSNCQHFGLDCRRHIGVRKRQKYGQKYARGDTHSLSAFLNPERTESPSSVQNLKAAHLQPTTLVGSSQQEGPSQNPAASYTTPDSFRNDDNQNISSIHSVRTQHPGRQDPGRLSGLHQPRLDGGELSKVLQQALIDLYTQQLFPLLPVVDNCDLEGPKASDLVRHAVFLAGSMMRQSYTGGLTSKEFFSSLKSHLTADTQQETPFAALQALCILSCWSCHDPTAATLDSPWQWIGSAVRLAIQLRLHEEANYDSTPRSRCARRLWWYININDILQSLCYSRQPELRHSESDVRLPGPDDFDERDASTLAFCQLSKLSLVLRKIEAAYGHKQGIETDQLQDLLVLLRCWLQSLPKDLQLFDEELHRKPYNRNISEVHIVFYVAVILVYLLPGAHRRNPRCCAATVTASLCIEHLYSEILHRGEACRLLPINAWLILFSCVPIYYCGPILALYRQPLSPSMGKMNMAKVVLAEMAKTYASAAWVMEKISNTSQSLTQVLDPSGPGGKAAGINEAAQPLSSPFSVVLTFNFSELFPPPNDWWPAVIAPDVNIGNQQEYMNSGNGYFEESMSQPESDLNTLLLDLDDLDWRSITETWPNPSPFYFDSTHDSYVDDAQPQHQRG